MHSNIGCLLFSDVLSPRAPRSASPSVDASSSQPTILVEHGSLVNFKVTLCSVFEAYLKLSSFGWEEKAGMVHSVNG